LVLTSEDRERQFEHLLVEQKPAAGGNPLYQVLWLPRDTPGQPWTAKLTHEAFGTVPERPLDRAAYELIRSAAWTPAKPAELPGARFAGFTRDPENKVALRSALHWRTGAADWGAVWALRNQRQLRFAPLTRTDTVTGPIRVEPGPSDFLLGLSLPDALGPL